MSDPRERDEETIDLEPVGDDPPPPPASSPEPGAAAEPETEPVVEPAVEPDLEPAFEPEVVEVTITEPRGKAKSHTAKTQDDDEPPLVRPGLGGAKLGLFVGVALLLGAMVFSGIRAGAVEGAGARVVALAVAVTLFQTLLHTGTGVGAIMIAARVGRRPTGALELAAARMLACVGAFQLVYHLPTLVPGVFGYAIGATLGLLAYAALVWGLFRLTRLELGVVTAGHVLLLLGVALGTHLTHLYRSAIDALGMPIP